MSADKKLYITIMLLVFCFAFYIKASVSDTGISPAEYRAMAFDQMHESDPSITMCPHCGQIIEVEGRT